MYMLPGFDTAGLVRDRAPLLYNLPFLQCQKNLHLWNVAKPRATPKSRLVSSFFCFILFFCSARVANKHTYVKRCAILQQCVADFLKQSRFSVPP